MDPSNPRRHAGLAVLLAVAVIVHGSLWPYSFQPPSAAGGPVHALLSSWTEHPSSLGDILGNVLLYAPLGLFAALATAGRSRVIAIVAAGAALSTTMELLQFYDADRTTSLWDVASNTFGTALGAFAGLLLRARLRFGLLQKLIAAPVPTFLLLAMLGYRLVPYVPVIDLHKYWNALKPLLFGPFPAPDEVFRYAAIWLTASELLAAIFGATLSLALAPLLVGFVLAGKVLIYASLVTRPEVVGAGIAVLIAWPILYRARSRTMMVPLVLLAAVLIERLEPFEFQHVARPFGWLPFRSFLGGSLVVNAAALMEKLFLYGSLLWLWQRAGLRSGQALALVIVVLLGTSLAETYLPGRSAEITDTLLALLLAVLFEVLEPAQKRASGWLSRDISSTAP
jgi:VanZ family protein